MAEPSASSASDSSAPTYEDLAEAWATICELLGAEAPEDAVSRIHTLTKQMQALDKREELPGNLATLSEMEEAFTHLNQTIEELRQRNGMLEERLDKLADEKDSDTSATDTSAIRMVLGISNIEQAEDFVERLDGLSTSVRRALDHLGLDVPRELSVDRADNVASYLDVLADQIDRLAEAPLPDSDMFEAAEELRAIEETLGIASAEDAREMEAMVRNLTEDLDALAHEREVLREAGLSAEEAVSMIQSMDEQLDDLYVNQDANQEVTTLPPGLQDTLGVESVEEAQRIMEMTEEMDTQIATLYEEQEQLSELGISSIDEAINMIRDMNDQLVELYEDVEARNAAQTLPDADQDTFQQLESLYARQEKLQTELGISDPEAIIQMVEDMNVQLETLYEDRDSTLNPEESDASDSPADSDLSDAERLEKLIESMAQQLDVLYGEKETLSDQGFDSADEATARIENLREEIRALRAQKMAEEADDLDADAIREWMTLRAEFDIDDPSDVRALIDTTNGKETASEDLPAEGDRLSETAATSGDAAGESTLEPHPDVNWQAGPALADAELRAALPTMDDEARNALGLAAIQLDASGRVASLNDAAYALPVFDRLRSKEEARGTHFFFDLAPSASTDAFYGRFHAGISEERLDARFPHLFTAPSHPPFVALVHMFYDATSESIWIMLRTT